METKANVRIMDRPARVMWSQRDPSLRRSGVGNLFVKNLAPTVDARKLQNAFSLYGNILSCKVSLDDKGNSKGFGFVHFESSEAANKAVQEMNGFKLDGVAIYVAPHQPKRSRVSAADTKWTNVFVKNLPGDYDEAKLRELFAKFGGITSVCLSKHEFSQKTAPTEPATVRMFGFVNFGNHEEAVKAVEALNEQKLGDNTIFVGRAQTKAERASSLARTTKREPIQSNLYIKNLEEGVTKDVLEKHFAKFGTITSATIALDQNGQSRGFGFVNFTTAEAAQKAIQDASNHAIPGFSKPLFVGLFEPKALRSPRIAAQKAMQQHQQLYFSPQMPYYPAPFGGQRMPNQPRGTARIPHNGGPAPGARRAQGPAHLAPHPNQVPHGAAPIAHPAPVAVPAAGRAPLTLPSKEQLLAMPPNEAQIAIGDYLFNSMLNNPHNGKITGMLLSMHASDLQALVNLVHDQNELQKHIKEATEILDEPQAAQ